MNKVAAAVLAVAMVGSMAVPAFATESTIQPSENNYASGNTTVKYQVDQGFTWTIHSEINFGSNRADATKNTDNDNVITRNTNNTVSVDTNTIPNDTKLVITVKGNGGGSETDNVTDTSFAIKAAAPTSGAGAEKTLSYTVTSSKVTANDSDVAIQPKDAVLVVPAGTDKGSTNMTFVLNTGSTESEFSGSYVGKLIYTASIKATSAQNKDA